MVRDAARLGRGGVAQQLVRLAGARRGAARQRAAARAARAARARRAAARPAQETRVLAAHLHTAIPFIKR